MKVSKDISSLAITLTERTQVILKKSTSRECVYIKREETKPIKKKIKTGKNIPRRPSKMYGYGVLANTSESSNRNE